MNNLLQYLIALGMLSTFAVIFYWKRTAPFHTLFWEGMQCENKGDFEGAADIYSLLIDECKKAAFKDKRLIGQAEQRLQTLRGEMKKEESVL
jgi:hypothetical protein